MKSSNYSNFCQNIFGRFFNKYKEEEIKGKNLNFIKANIEMNYIEYNSVAIFNIIIGLFVNYL